MDKTALWLAVLALAAALLAGCETTKGAGRDIEHAGEKMEDVVH